MPTIQIFLDFFFRRFYWLEFPRFFLFFFFGGGCLIAIFLPGGAQCAPATKTGCYLRFSPPSPHLSTSFFRAVGGGDIVCCCECSLSVGPLLPQDGAVPVCGRRGWGALPVGGFRRPGWFTDSKCPSEPPRVCVITGLTRRTSSKG